MENQIIMQHYKVTMAKHELSAIEMRIMAMVVLKLKEAQLEGYGKDVREIPDLFDKYSRVTIRNADIVVCDNYREVRAALKSLTKRDIELKKDKGTYFFNLVREAYYSDDKTRIDIDVSPHILPELIELGKNYTKFGLEFLFKTKSTHAIRWYQIGSHWLNEGIFYMSKDEIRELFKAQDKYKAHKDFQRRLITEPFEEVNQKSDINISIVQTHKEGKTIVGYTMVAKRKKNGIKQEKPEDLPPMLMDYINRYWYNIEHLARKYNYDHHRLIQKLKKRGIPPEITNQRHFDNATNKLVATVLAEEGVTNLTAEKLLDAIKL